MYIQLAQGCTSFWWYTSYLHNELMKSRGTQMEGLTQKICKLCHFINIGWHLEALNINHTAFHFR
jgi:hypothetical protein